MNRMCPVVLIQKVKFRYIRYNMKGEISMLNLLNINVGLSIAIIVLLFVILYFIIKLAVKAGVKEAYQELKDDGSLK